MRFVGLAEHVAYFLKSSRGLSKRIVGKYLGEVDVFNQKVRRVGDSHVVYGSLNRLLCLRRYCTGSRRLTASKMNLYVLTRLFACLLLLLLLVVAATQ